MNDHIVTLRSSNPVNVPLPHRDLLMLQCFLIRVMRMASKACENTLETLDTDGGVSLLAASKAAQQKSQKSMSSLSHLPTIMVQLV